MDMILPKQATFINQFPFLDLTSENFPYAIMATDPLGTILFVNQAFTKLTGYAAEDVVGHNPRELFKTGSQSSNFYKGLFAKIADGEPWEGYLRNRRKNGEIYLEHEMIYPVKDWDGSIKAFIAIKRDVSKNLKEIELFEQLSRVVDQSSELVYLTNKDGIIEYVNPKFEVITGYTKEEVIGKTPRILKSGLLSADEYAKIWQTVIKGKTLHKVIANKKKNGEIYYQETTITPIKGDDGNITHYVSTGNDITQKMLEEQESNNRLKYLESIYTLSAALGPANTLQELLEAFLSETLKLVDAKLGDICIFDDKKNLVTFSHSIGYRNLKKKILTEKIQNGIVGMVARTQQPYVSKEYVLDPNLDAEHRAFLPAGIGGVTLPIIKNREVLGTISISYPSSRTLSKSEIRVLMALSEIAGNAIQRVTLSSQTEQQLEFVRSMREIDQVILSSMDLQLSFEIILKHVLNQLKVDAASILIYDAISGRLEYKYGQGFLTTEIHKTSLKMFESLAGEAAYKREPVFVQDLQADTNNPITPLISFENFKSYYATPLIIKGEVKGVLEFFNRSRMEPDQIWRDMANTLAYQTSITLDTFDMFTDLQKSNHELTLAYDETIEGWSRALDLRDKETEGHTQRVTEKTVRLAASLGIKGKELTNIRWGALLHDIGKMGIPDHILLKPGPLSDEEREIIKKHTTYAYELISPIKYLNKAIDIPYCHHEKWDGSGYPRGLIGEQIPIAARIFAIVDVWDALTSDRPYRPAWTKEKTKEYILSLSGSHFDPEVLKKCMETGVLED